MIRLLDQMHRSPLHNISNHLHYKKRFMDILQVIVLTSFYSLLTRNKPPDIDLQRWSDVYYHEHKTKVGMKQHYISITEIIL